MTELPDPTLTTGGDDVVPYVAPPAPVPMQMLQLAIEQKAGLDVIAKLLDLQERVDAIQARREFDAAMANVKAKVGIIQKTGAAHQGKKYADMADIARVLDPVIAEYGLSYRYRSQRIGSDLVMTCIVCHRAGHYEENSLPGPLDLSGSKNPIQAVGSTSTYLMRYCLMQAFGLAASVNGDVIHDDDGHAAAGAPGAAHPWGRNGYGNGHSISSPGEYDPPPGQPTHKQEKAIEEGKPLPTPAPTQNDLYEALCDEADKLINEGISPVELEQWAKEIYPRRMMLKGQYSDFFNRYWLNAHKLVHDNWVSANAEREKQQKISERAIARRNAPYVTGRPSRQPAKPDEDDPEAIADMLKS